MRRPGAGRRGIALLLAVWLLALLTILAGEFIFSGRVRATAERNARDGVGAYALALAAYRSACGALAGEILFCSLDAEGRLLLTYRGETEGVSAEALDVPLGDGAFSWRIQDLDGRVNINEAQRPELARLLEQAGVGPGADRDTVIDSILDWRDTNREHRLNGAEEDYYRALDPPYSCKDGPFDVPEELLLVRGVTAAMFEGREDQGRRVPGLRDLVSTVQTDFNVNTASEAALLAHGGTRSTHPTPPSRVYAITATGRLRAGGSERTVRAVVVRDLEGDRVDLPLVYWNDQYLPEETGKGDAH